MILNYFFLVFNLLCFIIIFKANFHCLIKGHDWQRDKSGFDARTGNFYKTWYCSRCQKLVVKRCTKHIEDESLLIK